MMLTNNFASLVLLLQILSAAIVTATKEEAAAYFPALSDAEKTDYMAWLDEHFETPYSRHAFLPSSADTDTGAAVFWYIVDDTIHFAVAVRASGWLGFGISEAGGMLGSDVVKYVTANPTELIDSYILESRAEPLMDACQSWNLESSMNENGWIILEVNRKLDTEDLQDIQLQDDSDLIKPPTRLIAAWGDEAGVSYHGNNRARKAVRLFAVEAINLSETLTETSDNFFDVAEDNYEIPAQDTEYHDVCKTFAEIQQELGINSSDPLTAIGATPVLSEGTEEFIHHFTVYTQPDCSSPGWEKSMIYAWAPGDEGWKLPDDVGFALFESDTRQAINVEIHYNNPAIKVGKLDSSGVRFYVVNEERPQKAGVLELADPFVQLGGDEMISDGLSQFEFSCPESCSSAFFGGDKVTVVAECKIHL
eukprot:scaffold8177_cov106-Cylindrotheca_fusiformis.AAC.4